MSLSQKVRRVVTGHNEQGEAIVLMDGPAPFLFQSEHRPGFWSNDIWRTGQMPVLIEAQPEEPTLGPRRQLPGPRGSVLRINNIPPESGLLTSDAIAREFARMGNAGGSTHAVSGRHPMMHRTQTLDYAIILSGEIYLVLDKEETLLQAGDVVVQCGTNHAWSNRSSAPCVLAFMLLDGVYEEELAQTVGAHHPA
ncbi:cupin domain-containing protein [Aquabacter sp. P-9]|uniref:cupin domain-containing protein n=1 Tax=Aquabacter sediminis TaxID=3029197 RepID=UPI00237E6B0E|nr:cupin domain-containing protein [Aquabacter sp. P-9]MDE1567996.1 cupin domain-containing protein [Aquabacter sp. P-9]